MVTVLATCYCWAIFCFTPKITLSKHLLGRERERERVSVCVWERERERRVDLQIKTVWGSTQYHTPSHHSFVCVLHLLKSPFSVCFYVPFASLCNRMSSIFVLFGNFFFLISTVYQCLSELLCPLQILLPSYLHTSGYSYSRPSLAISTICCISLSLSLSL